MTADKRITDAIETAASVDEALAIIKGLRARFPITGVDVTGAQVTNLHRVYVPDTAEAENPDEVMIRDLLPALADAATHHPALGELQSKLSEAAADGVLNCLDTLKSTLLDSERFEYLLQLQGSDGAVLSRLGFIEHAWQGHALAKEWRGKTIGELGKAGAGVDAETSRDAGIAGHAIEVFRKDRSPEDGPIAVFTSL